MSKASLTSRHRPKKWADLVGNQLYTQMLRNTVIRGEPMRAYFFSGGRGTGKTSSVRILAKALLCPSPTNGDSCGVCPSCAAFEAENHPDYSERDAASENGIDDIRELRQDVRYTPTLSTRKVYVLDEVHGLSKAASDGLLKVLEDDSLQDVVFMFCTTEPSKVPETVVSRCLTFDFRRISSSDISTRITAVAKTEGLVVEHDAAYLIAEASCGSLRDALNILEQASLVADGSIPGKLVAEIIGFVSFSDTYNLFEAIAAAKHAYALTWMDEVGSKKSPADILNAMAVFLNQMAVVKAGGTKLPSVPEEYKEVLVQLASNFDFHRISAMTELVRLAIQDVRGRLLNDPQVVVSLLLVGLMNTRNGGIQVNTGGGLGAHPTVQSSPVPVPMVSSIRKYFEGEILRVIEEKKNAPQQ